MPVATASSAYLLEDRASHTLRGITGEAKKTTATAIAAANALDRIGSPSQVQRLERFERRLGNVATKAEQMSGRVQRSVGHMEGAIRRDTLKAEARLSELSTRMDALGRKRAAPHVELDGYAAMNVQLAALNRQLDALGRRTATAQIGAVGGAGGAAGRAGGRSGAFIGSGGVGFGTSRTNLIAGAALTALPVASALTGTLLPLAGSLTGAALGASAVGLAGGGALTAGIGALVSVAKPAQTAVKELAEEQKRYNEAVAQYGAASAQALEAQRKLDAAIDKAPAGAQNLRREVDRMTSSWRRLTAAGQTDIIGLQAGAASRLTAASPFLAAQSNRVAGAARREGTNLADWLTSPAGLIIVRDLTGAFADNLDEAEGTLENVLGALGNLSRAAIPFFHEGMVWLEDWTDGWEHSTRDISDTRQQMGGYLNDLRAWGRLGGAGFDLIRDLVMPGRQQGTSAVQDLTDQLSEWDDWARRNPDRIRRFYADSIDGTKELAKFLGVVVADLHDLADVLLPILSRFAQLGQLAGGAGLLLPTLIRVGLGRAVGGRGGSGTGGAAGAGGTAIVAGGMGRGRAAGSPRTDWTGWTAAGSQRPTRLGQARTAAASGARSAGRFAAPIAGVSAALGAAGTQGSLGERLQGAVSGLTFGLLPAPTTGAQASEEGAARAAAQADRAGPLRSRRDYDREIARQERLRARAVDKSHGEGASILGIGLHGALVGGPQDDEMRRNAAAAKAYTDRIRDLRGELRSYRREADRRSGVASELHGGQLADSFQQAFAITRQRKGPASALEETLADVLKSMRRMRPEGARVLGEATLTWAREVAKGNPRMQAIVKDMTDGIERRFSRMGKRVEVVNGQILTGSRAEWRQISTALSDPAEEARQRVTAAFTDIQRQAVGSLRAMGYTSGEANALVKARERGGAAAEQRTVTGIAASRGDTASSRARAAGTGDGIGDGPGAGPARRGVGGGGAAALMGANAGLSSYANVGARYGLRVSSGLRQGAITSSGNVSLHASGDAIDEAGPADGMLAYARLLAERYGSGIDELIHTPMGFGIKNGQRVPLSFWGSRVNADHNDHVHVGDRSPPGGGAPGGALGDVGGGSAQTSAGAVRLSAHRSGLHGVPGALADRAAEVLARGLERKLNDRLGDSTQMGAGLAAAAMSTGGAAGGNRELARRMMLRYKGGKWGPDQWSPLNSLWTRESNFDENAINAKSGAGGIPQALPPSKMGPGWQGNAPQQIGWGLGYIDGRYGTPAGAWGHSQAVGWYGRGGSGTARRPTVIGIGDHPRGEDFKVTPRRLGPPSTRAGGRGGNVHGLASVTIAQMNVTWARDGDLKRAVKDELRQAIEELTAELDDGVDADEDALIR